MYGATSYTWTLSPSTGWSFQTNQTDTIFAATANSNAQNATITVTANNECGSSAERAFQVIVNNAPTKPGNIDGQNAVCVISGSQTYSIAAVPEATNYTWSLPSGWSGYSATTIIYATPSANAQSGNIFVTANNTCGSSPASTLNVTVNTPPTAPAGISGNDTINLGQSTTLTAFGGDVGSGCTYQWYSDECGSEDVLGTNAQLNVSPVVNTTYFVRRVGILPCNETTTACASVTVTVIPLTIPETPPSTLSLYPNPTTGELTISNGQLTITHVEIFDVFGKNLIPHTSYPKPHTSINISHLAAGVYFVKITTEAGQVVKKVVKE